MSSRPALPTAEEIGTLVPIGRIAKDTPYSPDFLDQLARSGKIRAFKLNRDWLTTPAAVHDYIKSQTKRHEKALSLLQAAQKAFLAMTLILVVFSATPQARAQGLSNPPPSTAVSILHDLAAGWQHFLLSFGQALLGKTSEEYLADAPAPRFALAKHPIHPRGLPNRVAASATSETSPQVLGLSTKSVPAPTAASLGQIQSLIAQALQTMLTQGLLTGPKGDKGDSGQAAGFSGPNGSIQNTNGQTTSVIGGTPIVSYVPASSNGSYSGGSIAGFTNLSANTLTASGNLTVQGGSSFTSGTFSGALSAAATTLSSLTVSGPATFSGSTTIAGLTVSGLNPGLTVGSVAFQNASGLSQDNANFFYDSTNHRLGLGTTTPGQLLTVAGNAFITGNATTSGNQVVSGVLTVSGASTLATTTATNLTLSQALGVSSGGSGATSYNANGVLYAGTSVLQSTAAGTTFQVLRSNGNSAPTYSDIGSLLTAGSNINLSGTSTIAVTASPSFATLTVTATSTLATVTVTSMTTTGTIAIGTTVLKGTPYQTLINGSVTLQYPFSAVSSLTILGTQTAMTGPLTIQCFDTKLVALPCSVVTSVNANNALYQDLVVTLAGGSATGEVWVSGVQQFTYYLDPNNGSDNNNGTSAASAFATLAKVSAQTLGAGVTVGIATNSVFKAAFNAAPASHTLLSPPTGTGIFSYGPGSRPLFDASAVVPTNAWSKTGGRTNVYQFDQTVTTTSGIIPNIWENGNFLTIQSSIANVDSTPGSFFYTVTDGTHLRWYVHAAGGGNPATNGVLYEASQIEWGIQAGDNVTLSGLWTRRQLGANGSLETGLSATVINCRASEGGKHNSLFGPGSSVSYSTFDEAQWDQNLVGGDLPNLTVVYGTWATPLAESFLSDTWIMTGARAGQATYSHEASGTEGPITFIRPTVGNLTQGLYASGNLTIWGGTIDASNAAHLYTQTVLAIHDATFPTGSPDLAPTTTISTSTLPSVTDASNLTATTLTGNTFTGATSINLGNSGSTVNATGNNFSAVTSYIYNVVALSQITANNNTFPSSPNTNVCAFGCSLQYTPWAYQATSGQDQNSTPPPVVTNYPQIHYNFIQGANSSVIYDSPRAYNLTLTGGSYGVNGLTFNGSSDTAARANYAPVKTSYASVEAVVNFSTFTNAYNTVAILGVGSNYAWQVMVKSTGKLAVYVKDSTGTEYSYDGTGATTLSTGTWYDLLLSYSGTSFTLYVNGVADKTVTAGGNPFQDLTGGGGGTFYVADSNFAGRKAPATFADLKFWNVALTQAQAAQVFANTVAYLNQSHPAISAYAGLGTSYFLGNVGIGTTTPGHLITLSGGAFSDGATWSNASDRNLKANFATITPADILQKIDGLLIQQWNYKTDSASTTHIGPTAQDFYAAFHTGGESGQTSISTIDPAGVALLGIQALDQKIQALQGSLAGNATATNLSVYSPSNFSGDSVGEAKILTGQTSVRITFTEAYQYQPIITLTPEDQSASGEFVTDRNSTGFTIRSSVPVTSDVTFAWHSFASPGAKLFVSGGATQSITLVLPVDPATSISSASGGGGSSPDSATGTVTTTATSTQADSQNASSTPPAPVSGPSSASVSSSTPDTGEPSLAPAPPSATSSAVTESAGSSAQ